MNFWQQLEDEREARQWTKAQLAQALGVSVQRLNHWEKRGVPQRMLPKIAKLFGWSLDRMLNNAEEEATGSRIGPAAVAHPAKASLFEREDLSAHLERLTEKLEKLEFYTRVPVISLSLAARWGDFSAPYSPETNIARMPTTAQVGERAFAVRAEGDSMEPGVPEGFIVVVDPDRQPQPGNILLIHHEEAGMVSIKRLVLDGGQRLLRPDNPRYPIAALDEATRVIGVVVQVVQDTV